MLKVWKLWHNLLVTETAASGLDRCCRGGGSSATTSLSAAHPEPYGAGAPGLAPTAPEAEPHTHCTAAVSAVVVSNDGIGHLEGYVVWVGPARPLYCNSYVGQGQSIITVTDLRKNMARLREPARPGDRGA